MGLCPWAVRANKSGLLRYVTCDGCNPSDVARLIRQEADSLTSRGAAPLSSTLIVCPHVAAWRDFGVFNEWVFTEWDERGNGFPELETSNAGEKVVLVGFHPGFFKLYMEDVEVGTPVMSHFQWHRETSVGLRS